MQLGWKEFAVPSLAECICGLSPLVSWRITKGSETRTLIALYPALNRGQHGLFQQKLQSARTWNNLPKRQLLLD